MRKMEIKKRHGFQKTMVLFAYVSVLIISLFACDDQEDHSSKSGKLRLNLVADTTSLKKGVNSTLTKSVTDEFEEFLKVEDYRICITTAKDTVQSFDRFDRMPAEIELPEGVYTLVASKGDNPAAGFENPYFEGSTDFTIIEEMSTPLDVTCTLGNARITADYTDDFKEAYTDYTVLLSSAYATTELEIAKGETRPAYMKVDKEGTDVAIGIRLKKLNAEEEKTYYVPTAIKMERRQNVRLIFKTDGEALEGIGLDIMLDDSLTTETFTTKIPDFMWQQFDKPTLSADGFKEGDVLRLKTSVFEDDLRIGFVMPGGVNSLLVKHWEGDAEDEAEVIDFVTEPEKAKEKYYSWMVNEDEFAPLKGTKAGYLILKNAIKSLKAAIDESVEYHYKFYGKDATGKEYPTNEINLTIVVEPADAPFIEDFELPSEIVEGDELKSMVETILAADAVINAEKTTLTIESDNMEPISYHLMEMDDRRSLYEQGIGIEIIASTKLQMVFLKPFTALLSAPEEGGSRSYTYRLHLEDDNGKIAEVTKTIVVKSPKFELVTTEGDAFAKRIVLRTNFLGNEDKNKLTYQYLNGSDWTDLSNQSLKKDAVGNQWVDTLRNLTPETKYSVRAVYNKDKDYERISNKVTVMTESIGTIPNGRFEEWRFETKGYWEKYFPWKDEATMGWNTVNLKTTQDGSGLGGNLRYVANSGTMSTTDKGDGDIAALIRTVGWGRGNSAGGDASIIKHLTPGELFLGEVDNNTLEPIYGYKFNSRPTGFSFDYKYETKSGGNDKFVAKIVVLDANGEIIAQQQLSEVNSGAISSWVTGQKVRLQYTGRNGCLKADKIYILFKSSSSDNYDYLRKNLIKIPPFAGKGNVESVGSQLYIDNVELIYE